MSKGKEIVEGLTEIHDTLSGATSEELKEFLATVKWKEGSKTFRVRVEPTLEHYIKWGKEAHVENINKSRCQVCYNWKDVRENKKVCESCCNHEELTLACDGYEQVVECKYCGKTDIDLDNYTLKDSI